MRRTGILFLSLTLPLLTGKIVTAADTKDSIKPAVFIQKNTKDFKKVSDDPVIIDALAAMRGTLADFSLNAILGSNLTGKPVKILFKNLAEINPNYSNYDALGMKKGTQLYIYLNPKHRTAPPEALASILSHEALHQDSYNSINEETYAWTMEASVWNEMKKKNPDLEKYNYHPLVQRENAIQEMYVNAEYTNKLIRKSVSLNPGYSDLPPRSPGFENVD
jgi:hypothetical protein